MIICGIFQTPEFYVIVSVIAAAVIAITALPERKKAVQQHLITGELQSAIQSDRPSGAGEGHLEIRVHEGNFVSIRRDGLDGVSMAGAVSLAVNVSGFDVVIEERITPGPPSPFGMADSVVFRLDFLAPEWYHVRYESERYSEHAAFSLHVREGIVMNKSLIH